MPTCFPARGLTRDSYGVRAVEGLQNRLREIGKSTLFCRPPGMRVKKEKTQTYKYLNK